jgi:tetratricopeptide (TPR) repeat protein
MKRISPGVVLILLAAAGFTLATLFVPRALRWPGRPASDDAFQVLLGEGRKLFANQFFTMGDVYFHNGFYPSIFDQHEAQPDVAAPAHGLTDEPDSLDDDFRGPPKDWLDRFGRNFKPNKHVHLDTGGASGKATPSDVREILPWLKLAGDMNPQLVETYTVAAYWLRRDLKNPGAAEAFLRDGLRNNPDSYELLFDLGRLYNENYQDTVRARNVWKAAFSKWHQQEDSQKEPNFRVLHDIATSLGHLEAQAGHYAQAIEWLKIAQAHAPDPDAVQKQIDEFQTQLAAQPQ